MLIRLTAVAKRQLWRLHLRVHSTGETTIRCKWSVLLLLCVGTCRFLQSCRNVSSFINFCSRSFPSLLYNFFVSLLTLVATSHPCFLQHHVRCLSFERQAVCESTKSNFVCLFGGRVALYVEQNQPCGPFKSPSSRFQFGVMWWTGEPKPNRICWQSSSFFFHSLYMSPLPHPSVFFSFAVSHPPFHPPHSFLQHSHERSSEQKCHYSSDILYVTRL